MRINVAHPDASRIEVSVEQPPEWDPRLFGIPAPTVTTM